MNVSILLDRSRSCQLLALQVASSQHTNTAWKAFEQSVKDFFHESLSNFGARETAFPRSRMTLSHHTCGSRRRVGQKHGTKRDFDDTVDGLRRKGKVVSATSYLIDPETWSSPGGCMKLFPQACRILAGPKLLLRAMFARNCECLKRSTDTVSNGVADANTGKVYVI